MYRLIACQALWYLDHAPALLRPSMAGVLSYVPPRSGRRIRLVVMPMPVDGQWIVAVSNPHRKSWWKAFRAPLDAELRLAGDVLPVQGMLLQGEDQVAWRETYLAQFPGKKPRLSPDVPMVLFVSNAVSASRENSGQ